MEKTLKAGLHVILRGKTHYYNRRIPLDLLEDYKPRTKILETLGTSDLAEANRKAAKRTAALDEDFARKRTIRAAPVVADLTTELTADQITSLVQNWGVAALEADDYSREVGFRNTPHGADEEEVIDDLLPDYREAYALGELAKVKPQVDDLLRLHGIKLSTASASYLPLSRLLLAKLIETWEIQLQRFRGIPVVTPAAVPLVLPSAPAANTGDTLDALLKYWREQAPRKPKTAHEFSTAVRRFNVMHGVIAAKAIERRHVVAFKDKLIADGLAPGTVKKQLGALSAVLQLAADNDKIPLNPAHRVRLPRLKVEKKARIPYDMDDLKQIFSGSVFTAGNRPKAGAGEAAYWLPVIALFTGARSGEIGQLRVIDVKRDGNINYIDITDEGEGNSIKTESSRRHVPIHPELIQLGFLDYVAAARQRGDVRLFPLIKADRMGVMTGNWSKWWGRYARGPLGITDKRKVFHSFRHTFKDACRVAGIHKSVSDDITGHADDDNEGSNYGAQQSPLKPLADAIKKVKYPGLILSAPLRRSR